MTLSLELTVAAIACRSNRFLMVEEMVGNSQVINQPAGHVEPGESPYDAVIRETLEDSAWRFVPEAITGIYLWLSRESLIEKGGQLRTPMVIRSIDDYLNGVRLPCDTIQSMPVNELAARAAVIRAMP
jgi:hypothetical protein